MSRTIKAAPTNRGISEDRLTPSQRMYVAHLLADPEFNGIKAAKLAGYKGPNASDQLLSNPLVARAVGKAIKERCDRIGLTADDVLEYLRFLLFYNPLDHFHPGKNGSWLLESLNTLPKEVGRLIESMEVEVVDLEDEDSDDGNGRKRRGKKRQKSTFKVKLVSKSLALGLAMKHCVAEPEKHIKIGLEQPMDWNALYNPDDDVDLVEAQIANPTTKLLTTTPVPPEDKEEITEIPSSRKIID